MATFTMYLHEVLDAQTPDHANPAIIGLDTYPIWDEGYRHELNHKIIMRYWNREIGFETPLMFTHHMKRLMGEIMPYYNQLAKTTLWEFDPLITMDVENTSSSAMDQTADSRSKDTTTTDAKETGVEESQSTAKETSTSDATETGVEESESASNQKSGNESESVASEHPQTQLQGNEDYATASNRSQSVSESQSDTTGRGETQRTSTTTGDGETETTGHGETQRTSTTTGDGETETTGTTKNTASSSDRQTGFTGSRSQLLQEYRDTIIGVDNQILAELEVLFMGVWDTDEAYTRMQPSWFDPYPTIF